MTQRTARNISRARGASDISNGDCSSISRGEEPFGLESWFRPYACDVRTLCTYSQSPRMHLSNSFNVDSNCYRGVRHRMGVMRVLLAFGKEIPHAGRHLAA